MLQRDGQINWILDVGLAAGLLAAVAIVFGIDSLKGLKQIPPHDDLNELHVVEHRTDVDNSPTKGNRIGVTPSPVANIQIYDDVGRLLDGLGKGYAHTAFDFNDLRRSDKIAKYTVIFITCSTAPPEWLDVPTGDGMRPGTKRYTLNEKVYGEATKAIRSWVERGGTLYVSDWHFTLMAKTFPELIDAATNDDGDKQTVVADVLDQGLRDQIGPKIELAFDQPNWKPAAFAVSKASVLLRGEYASVSGNRRTAPLLVKFPVGEGNVIFTSFHNEKQNSKRERKLLEYLVFTTVTSRMQTQIQKTMQFAPQKSNLISASADNPIATQSYHKEKTGRIQIALGFADREATLRLTIVAPNGRSYRKDVTTSLVIEIADANAPTGDWQITVEAVKLPYPNFPINVVVGQE